LKKSSKLERDYEISKMKEIGSFYDIAYKQLGKSKPKGRNSSSKSIMIFSDIHDGSATAICSENPSLKGGSYEPNPLQKKLLESWYWVKDSMEQKPHVICINGEPCDGPNPKQIGDQSWTTDFQEQIDDAEKLLKVFPKPEHFVMTRGSDYHVKGSTYNLEELLAERLNATPYSAFRNIEHEAGSIRTDYLLTFKIHGKVFSVTHHIGFNRWFAYRTTALAREMADMVFLAGKYWTEDNTPSVIVRSHVHYFVEVRFAQTLGFTTPSWKLPDSHLFRGGLGGTAPSIGAVEVIVESNGKILVEPHIVSSDVYPKHNILDLTK